jgi:predicted methyltransferase
MSDDERIKCPRCDGHGTVANPAFDGMSTSEMYDDMGYEETDEFLTEYTRRGGMYDIMCPCCNGQKVITVKEVNDFRDREEMYAEMAAEMRYGGM